MFEQRFCAGTIFLKKLLQALRLGCLSGYVPPLLPEVFPIGYILFRVSDVVRDCSNRFLRHRLVEHVLVVTNPGFAGMVYIDLMDSAPPNV